MLRHTRLLTTTSAARISPRDAADAEQYGVCDACSKDEFYRRQLTMATRRKFKPGFSDAQQPLDPRNLRSQSDRNHGVPAVGSLPADRPRTAEAALPTFLQVVNVAAVEATTMGTSSERDIELIVARQSLRWRLPPQLFRTAIAVVTRYCQSVHDQEPAIKAFLSQTGPASHPNTVYGVFHHGQPHIYYDAVPTGILALRDTVQFWIDRTSGDYRSRGRPKRQLSPRSERLLAFVSQDRNAGKQITIPELYQPVCLKPPSNPGLMENSVREAVSGLNLFARPDIFAHKTDPQAKLVPITNAYQIRADTMNECCIISVVRSMDERS